MAKERTPEQQEQRRLHDMRTISQMICIYCAGHHSKEQRTQIAYCGDSLCPACEELDVYAHARTLKCPHMDVKVSCDRCEIHCYAPERLEQIRAVMRYSGPRMLFKHPVAGIRHAIGK